MFDKYFSKLEILGLEYKKSRTSLEYKKSRTVAS